MKTAMKTTLVMGLIIYGLSVNAQNLNYGIQGGLNGALQSDIGNLYDNNDMRLAGRIGAFGNYTISDKFLTQIEVNYDQRGSSYDEYSNHYDYISVPLLASYQLHKGQNKAWSISALLGPNTSFLVNAITTFDNSELEDQDQFELAKKVEFGAMGGFVVRYPVMNSSLLFNINYTLGLTQIDDVDTDQRNKVLNFSVGYEF